MEAELRVRIKAALLPAAISLALAATPTTASAAPALHDASGLRILSEKQLDSRLFEVTVQSAALPGPAQIRVLLPAGYGAEPTRRYPVLYLLHGTSGGAADWTTMGDAESATAAAALIVVMPDIALTGDGGGWCTNWVNGGAYGQPEWETFHIEELIPWVDHNLRTIAARDGRAIAGLSQGGFCSMSYPARHPDLFATALSYSGAPDIAYDVALWAPSTAVINATEVALDHVPPNSMFGDRATNEINWADHDPATLANNLRGMNLLLYSGDGAPGPLDPSPVNPGTPIEAVVGIDTKYFHDRLDALGIASFYDPYGPGTHSWPYWARDLHESIGAVMADFAHPPPAPARVTYTIADPRYSVFGWQVAMHRAAEEFSTLEDADASGFALAGSGSGTVITPPFYAPGSIYTVALHGDTLRRLTTATSDAHGRLHIEVPLGPANPYQQDTAQAAGTAVYTTTVSLVPSDQPASAHHGAGARGIRSGRRACARGHRRRRPARVCRSHDRRRAAGRRR